MFNIILTSKEYACNIYKLDFGMQETNVYGPYLFQLFY